MESPRVGSHPQAAQIDAAERHRGVNAVTRPEKSPVGDMEQSNRPIVVRNSQRKTNERSFRGLHLEVVPGSDEFPTEKFRAVTNLGGDRRLLVQPQDRLRQQIVFPRLRR